MAQNNSPLAAPTAPAPTQSLPDVPPQIFDAFQVLGKVLEKAELSRSGHMEAERAVQLLFQHAVEGTKAIKSLANLSIEKECQTPRDVVIPQVQEPAEDVRK